MFKKSNKNKPKMALLIGINYEGDEASKLNGCINDIENVNRMLTNHFGYKSENVTMLRDDVDDDKHRPTGMNICHSLFNIAMNSHKYGELWIHYSGHGVSIDDRSGDEKDGKDEAIVPCDYKTGGIITDDLLFRILSYVKCPTFIMMDCCHSATSFDLPYIFIPKPIDKRIVFLRENHKSDKSIRNKYIYAMSGCRDDQTSADAYFTKKSAYGGAFTEAMIAVLTRYNFQIQLSLLYLEILKYLKLNRFEQQTRLSSSNKKPNLYINPKNLKKRRWSPPWTF